MNDFNNTPFKRYFVEKLNNDENFIISDHRFEFQHYLYLKFLSYAIRILVTMTRSEELV